MIELALLMVFVVALAGMAFCDRQAKADPCLDVWANMYGIKVRAYAESDSDFRARIMQSLQPDPWWVRLRNDIFMNSSTRQR